MNIQEFPLAWRWTQPSHAVLPADVLARIHPLSQEEAAHVYERGGLRHDKEVALCPAGSGLRSWLHNVQPDSEAAVFVSWSKDLAVRMSWGIFVEYWDDFCYPSSDDITVIPVVGNWSLIYHHEERFEFSAKSSI